MGVVVVEILTIMMLSSTGWIGLGYGLWDEEYVDHYTLMVKMKKYWLKVSNNSLPI